MISYEATSVSLLRAQLTILPVAALQGEQVRAPRPLHQNVRPEEAVMSEVSRTSVEWAQNGHKTEQALILTPRGPQNH